MERLPELDDALQNLAEDLGRRLIVLDRHLRVIAYSIHESPADRQRLSQAMTHSDLWPTPNTARHPWTTITIADVGPMVFQRLTDSEGQIVGHLTLADTDTDTDTDTGAEPDRWDHLARPARHLGSMLAAWQSTADARMERSRSLTADLVDGTSDQRAQAADALLAEGHLSVAERYCAVAVGAPPSHPSGGGRERAALATAITVRFVTETSTATVVDGALGDGLGVLVFPRPVVAERLTRILDDPRVAGVRAGIGPLTDISAVHTSFARARLAWRATVLAPSDHPTVLPWDQAGLDGVLARLPLSEFDIDDLPPAVATLLRHDVPIPLLDTLQCYLDCGGDAVRTSRVLGIHRSTLYYRLDRLRTVLTDDLADGRFRTELHTGLRLAQLAGLPQGSALKQEPPPPGTATQELR